jgi:hypothetical protein
MQTKIRTTIVAALILGATSAALANDQGEERGGGPPQTWQDIERSRQEIESMTRQDNAGSPDKAYDLQTAEKQRSSREKTKGH